MQESLVSIVTPCYNGEKYVGRFLDSIINQSYDNIELIIVNDGSFDRTEEIILSYKKKIELNKIKLIYVYQNNQGQASALNNGLKYAHGIYLLCMDSDDEISKDFIKSKVNFLERNKEYAYCYGKALEIDENSKIILKTYEKREKNERLSFFEDILYCRNIFFSGYLVRMNAIDKVIPNRNIYDGRGGQNAQILLPLAWFYSEPGYEDDSYYLYYVRAESHSHSINTSQKIIQQLYNYENILCETLVNIPDKTVLIYIDIVKKHYTKLRFGNAIDTKNIRLIKNQYAELNKNNNINFKDFLIYIKYTNRIIRKILKIEENNNV